MDPKTSTTKPLLWLVGLFVLAGLIGLGAYTYSQRSGGGGGNANTNAAENTNLGTNVNAAANANSPSNTNTPANTSAEWQTYRSGAKGFAVEYPNSWQLLERLDESIVFAPGGRFGDYPELSVEASSKKGSASFDVLKNLLQDGSQSTLNDRVEVETPVNGLKAYWVSGTDTSPLTDGSYPHRDRALLDGEFFIYKLNGNNAREYFQRMLQSFNIRVPDDTVSTYTNDTYEYSFEYPSALMVQDYTKENAFLYNKLRQQIIVPRAEGEPYIVVDFVDDAIAGVKRYLEETEHLDNWNTRVLNGKQVEVAAEPLRAEGSYHYFYVGEHRGSTYVLSAYVEAAASSVIFY